MSAATGAVALRVLQRAFAGALRGGARGPVRHIAAGHRSAFPPARRLDVYRGAYAARLVDVLADDYPALREWLGHAAFEGLARRYLAAHPSRHPNLNRFGEQLPAFVRARGARTAFARALARFERAVTRAFDAPAAAPLASDALAAAAPASLAGLRLAVHPSVEVLRLPRTVVDYFAAWRRGAPPPPPRAGRTDVLVWRRDDRVVHRHLTRRAARVLRALQRGEPLARALAVPDAPGAVQAWFAQWRRDGVFAATDFRRTGAPSAGRKR